MIKERTLFDVSIFISGLACVINSFLYSFQLMFLSSEFNSNNFLGMFLLLLIPFYIVGIYLYYFKKIKKFKNIKLALISYAAYTGTMFGIIGTGNFYYQFKLYGTLETLQEHISIILYILITLYFCTSAIIKEIRELKIA